MDARFNIDYTYQFAMERFSVIDHFLLLQHKSKVDSDVVKNFYVEHNVDNCSDHDPLFLVLNIDISQIDSAKRVSGHRINWSKASCESLFNYSCVLSDRLSTINLPFDALLCTDLFCNNVAHRLSLNEYCHIISKSCLEAGSITIPSCNNNNNHNSGIPGWKSHVQPLREKSLFWHHIWIEAGRPGKGVLASIMRNTRAQYHSAIKDIRVKESDIRKEKFAELITCNNNRDFWKEVNKIKSSKKNLPNVVDDYNDESDIAETFASKYMNLYSSVSCCINDVEELKHNINRSINANDYNDALHSDAVIRASEIKEAILKLKLNKSDGIIGLQSDNFVNAGDDLHVHLAMLLTGCFMHGYVPDELCGSSIIPIPKGNNSDRSDSNNYRGISLSSIVCKIIDLILLSRYSDLLCTSELQFGFKSKMSTSMCTSIIKEVVSYYNSNCSSVYCTLLDATKAFDRVNYCKLFKLLIARKIPSVVLRFLLQMYTGFKACIYWNGFLSNMFVISNGVKQGGILSPLLFCVYFDVLIDRLTQSGYGCYIGLVFLAVLAYADDIVLLAPTATAMRHLLAICDIFAADFDVMFNATKSKCIFFDCSRRHLCCPLPSFYIGNNEIEYVDSWPHLGHILSKNGKHDNDDISRCYVSLVKKINEVICYFGNLNAPTKLKLLYSFCSSLYGAELWDLSSCDFECINVAWRKALKRIWRLPWQTHTDILYSVCNKWPMEEELYRRSLLFGLRCIDSESSVVRYVSRFGIKYGLMHSVLGKNVLFGCQRYGIKVVDYFYMGLSSFRGSSFWKLRTNCTAIGLQHKNNAQWLVNLLNECILLRDHQLSYSGLDISQLNYIILYLCTS